MGKIYQQTFIDTYAKGSFAKLYDRKNALVAADMLNDKVLPFYQQHQIPLLRVLTDRGTEYCGAREHHEYQLYLAIEDVDHSKTKARSPQTKDPMTSHRQVRASVNVSTRPFRKSFTRLLSAGRSTIHSMPCRKTWTSGWKSITSEGRTQAGTVTAKPLTKLGWTLCTWHE